MLKTMVETEVSCIRPIYCEQGLLSRPDGSAIYTQGNTAVMAAVYGPAEVKQQKELIDRTALEVIFKPKIGLPGISDKCQENTVRKTCQSAMLTVLHPRTAVTIVLQEMQNSGCLLSCCVNASCMALMDAGMAMKNLVAAVTCIINPEGQVILDPTNKQVKECSACLTFVFDSHSQHILAAHAEGLVSEEQFQACLLACRTASQGVFTFYRNSVQRKFSKEP